MGENGAVPDKDRTRTADHGSRFAGFGDSGLSQQHGPKTEIPRGEAEKESPEAFAEFGVGFIQRGIVLFCGIGMDRGLPPACRSFITNHRGTRGGPAISSIPWYRQSYGESSIALLFRRQLCGHSITSYPGFFWRIGCCVKYWAWQSGSVMEGNICSTWISK